MNHKLSIITINFNNKPGLIKTTQSVFKQTFKDFEYLIIDGGSSDGSESYIELNKEKFSYYVSEPDMGIYNAMNKGIKKANGKYLLFLNSGDVLLNNEILQKNHNHLNEQKDIVYFDIYYGSEDNKHRLVKYPDHLRFYFFYNNTICHQAVFFKRKLFSDFGLYDETLKILADWKFLIMAITKFNASYIHINDACCLFNNEGISSSQANRKLLYNERLQVMEEEFPAFAKDYEVFHKIIKFSYRYKLYKLKTVLTFLKKFA